MELLSEAVLQRRAFILFSYIPLKHQINCVFFAFGLMLSPSQVGNDFVNFTPRSSPSLWRYLTLAAHAEVPHVPYLVLVS
jgi:hypothetical protein